MDQRSIVLYLGMKNWSALAIHKDLVETLKDDAVSYSSVTLYLRTPSFAKRPPPSPRTQPPRN
jgi:hypothetical protein